MLLKTTGSLPVDPLRFASLSAVPNQRSEEPSESTRSSRRPEGSTETVQSANESLSQRCSEALARALGLIKQPTGQEVMHVSGTADSPSYGHDAGGRTRAGEIDDSFKRDRVTSVENAQGGIRCEAKRVLRSELRSWGAALELPFRHKFTFGISRVHLTQTNHQTLPEVPHISSP